MEVEAETNSTVVSGEGEPISLKFVLETVGLIAICLCGFIGNILIAFTLIKRKQLKHPSNRFVLSLNVSSLLFCILVFPFVISTRIVSATIWHFGEFWCQLCGFITLLTISICTPTIAIIAVDRYVAIVRPMKYSTIVTLPRSTIMIASSWIVAFFISLPPLLEWCRFGFVSELHSCNVIWRTSLSYSIIYIIVDILLPFSVILVCYAIIFKVAIQKCQKVGHHDLSRSYLDLSGRNARESTESSLASIPPIANKIQRRRTFHDTTSLRGGHDNQNPQDSSMGAALAEFYFERIRASASMTTLASINRIQSKFHQLSTKRPTSFGWIPTNSPKKGFLTICLVIGSYLLSWIPLTIHIVDEIITSAAHGDTHLPRWYPAFSQWMVLLSFIVNPIVYGVMNRQIRKEIVPALFPPKNIALQGLPRKNSAWRISSTVQFTLGPMGVSHSPSSAAMEEGATSNGSVGNKDLLQTLKELNEEKKQQLPLKHQRRISAPCKLQLYQEQLKEREKPTARPKFFIDDSSEPSSINILRPNSTPSDHSTKHHISSICLHEFPAPEGKGKAKHKLVQKSFKALLPVIFVTPPPNPEEPSHPGSTTSETFEDVLCQECQKKNLFLTVDRTEELWKAKLKERLSPKTGCKYCAKNRSNASRSTFSKAF